MMLTRARLRLIGLWLLVWLCQSGGIVLAADKKLVYLALFRGVTAAEQGFMDYLQAQPNHNIEFHIADAETDAERVQGFVADIRLHRPDLIYTFGTTVTLAIAGAMSKVDNLAYIHDIPIVFNIVADPVGAKLISTMNASSGRNLTGTSHLVPTATQVNAVTELGDFHHVGVLFNAAEKNSLLQVDKLTEIIDQGEVNLSLSKFPIDGDLDPALELTRAINEAKQQGVDILYLPSDSFLIAHADSLAKAAMTAQLPVFSATDGPVEKGYALAGLVSKYYLVGQFAGYKAWQVLRGSPVSEVPIETLSRFNTVVNMKVAEQLDYYPPVNVLLNATLYR
ncbi:ABC transporter substrate-binding protein [Reinekea sp.]|jgi:putative ABC transport system substrate-binding protein|uniref:ABC transporter substrate-binding protein n=1 Tax=Reinekea sp. TaxID=1970455 RepID=UPI002A8192E7|nr:ABC transporter substrate-binding protein [Reinekea sp.]